MPSNRWLNWVLCSAVLFLGSVSRLHADLLFADPSSDTFGSGPVQHDITAIQTSLSGMNLIFQVTFAGAVAPPSANAADSVVGFIDIDADQNPSTGVTSHLVTNGLGDPAPGLGVDFYLDIFSEIFHPGLVEVVETAGATVTGMAPITFAANRFLITVPLSFLGGDDGFVNYGVIVGTFAEATDQAPNPGQPVASSGGVRPIPEPGSLVLFTLGLLGLLGSLRKCRPQPL